MKLTFDLSKEGIHQHRLGYGDERNSAIAWSIDAPEYLSAARILFDEAGEAGNGSVGIMKLINPLYFLLCQSIELALKAYLVNKGADDKGLKKIGHSLVKAMNACEAEGYIFAADFAGLVGQLDEFHKAHTFRYYRNAYLQIPLPLPSLEIVENSVQAIATNVRTSVSGRLRAANP